MADERGVTEPEGSERQSGARFFDERKRDRGQAINVTRRVRSIDGLTTLDITTRDRPLAEFLGNLDRARLHVEPLQQGDEDYSFTWASGYDHGDVIRVHGSLEGGNTLSRARRP